MVSMNLNEAQMRLSALVEAALRGEDVVIANAGEPLVRLVPCQPRKASRQPGRLRGQIRIADNFDSADDTTVKLFEQGL
jgi:prevent-host-death family protein